MISVDIPTLLGPPQAQSVTSNIDPRVFGSSQHCRALLNTTDYFAYELKCEVDSVETTILKITEFPTWEVGFEDYHLTVYWRSTALGDANGYPGLTNPISDFTVPVSSQNFVIRSHIDTTLSNYWVVDKRTYLYEKVLPLDIPW